MTRNLRKQCVNILFQLGVFFDIQRKSHFCKTLIISTLSQQRHITEYHFKILISLMATLSSDLPIPTNPIFKVEAGDNFEVWGVVIHLIRTFEKL